MLAFIIRDCSKIYKKSPRCEDDDRSEDFFRKTFLISNRNLIHRISYLLVRTVFRRELGDEDVTDEDDDHGNEGDEPENIGCRLEVFANQSQGVFAAAGGDRDDDEQGDDDAHEAFADDETGSKEDAAVVAGFNIFFFMARAAASGTSFQGTIDEVAHNGADDQRNFKGRR